MARDCAIIFGDLIGKLGVLAVPCDKCGRAGRYPPLCVRSKRYEAVSILGVQRLHVLELPQQ
jgi:hypothetical protein